jgi:hypothetical protein
MNYYKYLFKRTNHAPSTTNVPSGNNVVMSESETEISGSTLKLFANALDPHYKKTNGTQGLQLFRGKVLPCPKRDQCTVLFNISHSLPACYLMIASIVSAKTTFQLEMT